MTDDNSKINSLPDVAVLTVKQVATLTGLSTRTLWNLANRGEGPPRVQLSPYRTGYPLAGFREWLKQRELTEPLPWRRSPGEAA